MSCLMGQVRLQLAAMAFFVAGFVLAGSGWSLVISSYMQSRADWSVCGQDMCSCLPSTGEEPYCALCLVEDIDNVCETSCESTDSSPTDSPKRIPKSDRLEAVSAASQSGCAAIFLSFVFGSNQFSIEPYAVSTTHLISQDDVPLDPDDDLPTPPPRA